MTTLAEFNVAADAEATALLRPCLDVDRWREAILAGRPYSDLAALASTAREAAEPFTADELERALRHHPRIGERAGGTGAEAGLSRAEQSGLDTGGDVRQRLVDGNVAYEHRFGHVFLIRAAGRSSEEILAELQRRLHNDEATESAETADQLRQIAILRLEGAIGA